MKDEPKLQSHQPGPHQSSAGNAETHSILHGAVTETSTATTTTAPSASTDKRHEPRDPGETEQHEAEKRGYVKPV